MATMFFVIVPKVVDLLNGIISIVYNLFGLILYAFFLVGISIFIFAVYFYIKKIQ